MIIEKTKRKKEIIGIKEIEIQICRENSKDARRKGIQYLSHSSYGENKFIYKYSLTDCIWYKLNKSA